MEPKRWKDAKDLLSTHRCDRSLLWLEDNEVVIGAFCGDPFAREVYYVDGRTRQPTPELASAFGMPKFRVLMNFYMIPFGIMKVMQSGANWFKAVLRVRDRFGLGTHFYRMHRENPNVEEHAKWSILYESAIPAETAERIHAAKLYDLELYAKQLDVLET